MKTYIWRDSEEEYSMSYECYTDIPEDNVIPPTRLFEKDNKVLIDTLWCLYYSHQVGTILSQNYHLPFMNTTNDVWNENESYSELFLSFETYCSFVSTTAPLSLWRSRMDFSVCGDAHQKKPLPFCICSGSTTACKLWSLRYICLHNQPQHFITTSFQCLFPKNNWHGYFIRISYHCSE